MGRILVGHDDGAEPDLSNGGEVQPSQCRGRPSRALPALPPSSGLAVAAGLHHSNCERNVPAGTVTGSPKRPNASTSTGSRFQTTCTACGALNVA